MKYPLSLASALLLMAVLSSASARPPVAISHPAPGHRLVFDERKFMRVSELRPGMRGYALTVFKGTRIDKFGIEILGVMTKFNAGKDYILFRALDGPPVTRHLNIAHGMSGSPIYVKGRLVGAISMEVPGSVAGPSFGREPIGLATPIENMFDAWSPDLPKTPASGAATADARPLSNGGTNMSRYDFSQIDLPVMVSGMPRQNITRLQAAMSPYHIQVMAGAGGGTSVSANPLAQGAKLVPGAAVGVSLVQGDMDFTATGTVTYRDGDRVLIFGHPFFGLGPIDAALTTAYVVDIYPSFQDSVKLGSPIKTVGRVFQDRPFSVGGQIGVQPHMVPFTINVNDLSIKRRQSFHMRVIDHPLLTGTLVTQFASAAIAQIHGQPGDSVATVTMDADIEEFGHVKRTNTFYDAVSIDQSAIGDLQGLTQLLSSNPFYPLSLKSLTMAITIENRHDTAEVDHIFLKQTKYAPGDTVQVGVVLKPFKRDFVTRTVAVKIPLTTPSGTLQLSVKGGGSDGGGISLGGGLILLMASGPTSPVSNVRQLVKQYLEKARNDDLVTRLVLPTSALNVNGEKLSGLPPTLAGVMVNTRTSGLKAERDEVKVVQRTPYIVSGTQSLAIVVQKKSVTEPTASPAPPDVSPAGGATGSGDSASVPETAVTTSLDNGSGDDPTVALFASRRGEWVESAPVMPETPVAVPPAPALPPVSAAVKPTGTETPVKPSAAGTVETPTPVVKTIGRLASVWRQDTATDFSAGTLKNVTVTSAGDVRLSAALSKVAETGESYIWAALPDGKGSVYAGTGDHGMVFKIDAAGKATPFFETRELEVTALALDAAGNLYAGTAPNGIVFKIGTDGKGSKFFTAAEKYVTALAMDAAGSALYVATGGGKGTIYHVPLTGETPGKPFFSSPEANILSMAIGKDGTVYAGASPDGIVYQIAQDGVSHVLYDAPEPQVSALAVDTQGSIYAGTSPKGNIYKINADGYARLLSDRATSGILSLKTDSGDNLYACAGNNIYRIGQDETVQTFTAPTDEQFITLGMDASAGRVYAGTSAAGTLYTIAAPGSGDVQGSFQSTVHDAGLRARWGTLTWMGTTPPGTRLTLQTRTGDVETPDASWSLWSPEYAAPAGQAIASPQGRYLQYQAMLSGDAAAVAQGTVPRLDAVTAYYLPRNQAPTIRLTAPAGGEALSRTATLRWTAGDPDKDTLAYDLSYSTDSGKTWVPLKKKPAAASSTAAAPNKPVTDQEVADKVKEMRVALDKHPEMPAAVRKQIIDQAPTVIRQALVRQRTQAATAADSSAVAQTSYAWDTTQVPDGTYQVRVIASDQPSNPQDALTAKVISSPFIIANKPPTLTLTTGSLGAGSIVAVHGVAATSITFVKAVQARVDGGDLIAGQADDGLFDSTHEAFTLITPPLVSGSHIVEVQAIDQAGNIALYKLTVKVR